MTSHPDIDLVDGTFWGRNPNAELSWLRENSQVWRDAANGGREVATYDLVKHVSRHPELLSHSGDVTYV